MKKFKKAHTILLILTIFLILAYFLIASLPHEHDCLDFDCAICTVIENYRNQLAPVALLVGLFSLLIPTAVPLRECERVLKLCNQTLIDLKVKLSD